MKEIEEALRRSDRAKAKRTTGVPARLLAREAVDALLDKKAREIVVMDMRGISGVADVFVVATGDSDLQIKAAVDSVRERLRDRFEERPWHVEGYEHRQWVLVDYVDLVVHVFLEDRRRFYDLERLWGDAPRESVADEGQAAEIGILAEPWEGEL